MKYRSLGDTGFFLSSIGMGCEALGGTDWGTVNVDDAMSAVRTAWDAGITVFDTADAYGLGLSETRLSEALGKQRHNAVIVSKFGVRWSADEAGRARTWKDSTPHYLATALDKSLMRLRVEQIPLYLLHWPDNITPIRETIEALEKQRQAGKIGIYGVSNVWDDGLVAASKLGARTTEIPLNLLDRRAEGELSRCADLGVGVLTYGPYAQGLLCGRYDRDTNFGRNDRRHRLPQFTPEAWNVNAGLLENLRIIADRHSVSPAQIALQWVLKHDGISSVLVGTKSSAQVLEAVNAAESLPLSLPDWQTLNTWSEAISRSLSRDVKESNPVL